MTLVETIRAALPATESYGGKAWEEWAEGIAALFVDSGWSCHRDSTGRLCRVHDKNSIHMDGCIPLYVLLDDGQPENP